MADDHFEIWLGRIGREPGLRGALHRSVNLAGGLRAARKAGGRFTGARIGRGSAVGSLLASRYAARRTRRVVVKTRVVRLRSKGAAAAAAHLRYLQRDGTTRAGGRGTLYSAGEDAADGKAFLERGAGDRHQFRFIVSAEDGAQYDDLRPLVRRLMAQAANDLDTSLDWVAVDHFNTGHPHSHIVVRGKDDTGRDLVLARSYLTQGLRERAAELVSVDLGPRSDGEIAAAIGREMRAERFTPIDRRLLRAADEHGLVAPHHRDGVEQAARAGRLATLARLGLAREASRGIWRLDDDLEPTLRAMGRRGDIIATLDRAARAHGLAASPAAYAIYEPGVAGAPVVGRVAELGLADYDGDRSYLVVDGIDGCAHYVDAGVADGPRAGVAEGAIVRIEPAPVEVRDVDRTIAAIAGENGGWYAPELHALHDPSASERFIATHVRRLEAMRRIAGIVERGSDGIWRIAPDHLERVLAYERGHASEAPVRIDVLAEAPLDRLVRHDGITALDEDPDLTRLEALGDGFGRAVAEAVTRRRHWLAAQGLDGSGGTLAVLRRRELLRVAAQLSRELGIPHAEPGEAAAVRGIYRRSVQVGARRLAVIEGRSGFALVPWRPVLERQLGRTVSGVMRGGEVSWAFGRQRAGPER